MLLRLVSPVIRSGSSKVQFVKRLPADLSGRLVGMSLVVPLGDGSSLPYTIPKSGIRLSLRTADASEAKARHAELAAYFEKLFQSLRDNRPVSLTRAQAVAMSRRAYEAWAEGEGRERTIAVEVWSDSAGVIQKQRVTLGDDEEAAGFAVMAQRLVALEGTPLEEALRGIIRPQLLAEGIAEVTPETWARLVTAFRAALVQALEVRARNAEGDYSPDPKAGRFGEWQRLEGGKDPATLTPLSFGALVAGWWAESEKTGQAKPATHDNYRGVFREFARFLKHDDAKRVSPEDVIAFKDARLGKVSARTVKDHDLPALKSVFGWAVANRKLPSNPALGITLKVAKKLRKTRGGIPDYAVNAILGAALAAKRGDNEREKVWLARRWAPWLMAYTGARVGEICQLRKEDVVEDAEGNLAIHITADAGTVKTETSERWVPLHSHLRDLGFGVVVKSAKRGHLFITPNPKTKSVLGPLKDVRNKVGASVREHFADTSVDPNHGWRHRFKTIGRRAGIADAYLDALCGHEQATVGRGYGEYELDVLRREVEKLPRIELTQSTNVVVPKRSQPGVRVRPMLVVEPRRPKASGGGGVRDTVFFRGERG